MKKSVLILGLLLSSASAFALRGGDFGVGNGGDGLEMAFGGKGQTLSAPTSLSATFEGLQKVWDKAKMMTNAAAAGTWKRVAEAEGCGGGDFYDSNGLRNSDFSLPLLYFRYLTKSELALSGEESDSAFAVTFYNSDGFRKDQGPYKIRSLEPQFSRYVYSGDRINKSDYSSRYLNFSCRIALGDGSKMVCKYEQETWIAKTKHREETFSKSNCYNFAVFAKETSKKLDPTR